MRYIDAHKLRKMIQKHETVDKALALTLVNSTPTEDTTRYGKWHMGKFSAKWECPYCYNEVKKPEKYCCECGARLQCWWEGENE